MHVHVCVCLCVCIANSDRHVEHTYIHSTQEDYQLEATLDYVPRSYFFIS